MLTCGSETSLVPENISDDEDAGVRIAGRPLALSIAKPEEFDEIARESFVSRRRSSHHIPTESCSRHEFSVKHGELGRGAFGIVSKVSCKLCKMV